MSLSLSWPTSLSLYFFSPVQLRRGSDRAALVGTWHPARPNHHNLAADFCYPYLGSRHFRSLMTSLKWTQIAVSFSVLVLFFWVCLTMKRSMCKYVMWVGCRSTASTKKCFPWAVSSRVCLDSLFLDSLWKIWKFQFTCPTSRVKQLDSEDQYLPLTLSK